MTQRFKALLVACALFAGANAHAELVAGDGGRIQDTATGLTWLRTDLTAGLSFNQVSQQLLEGGSFFGFRYASRTDVYYLLEGNVASDGTFAGREYLSGYGSSDSAIGQAAKALVDLFGPTWSAANGASIFAYTDCMMGGGVCQSAWAEGVGWGYNPDTGAWSAGQPDDMRQLWEQNPNVGSWLVMDTQAQPVPEPSTYALIGLGLTALAIRARRRTGQTA